MDIYKLHPIIAAILTLVVGVYPYFMRPSRLSRLFALSNVSLAIWNLSDLLALISMTHQTSLLIDRVVYASGIFTVLYFFQFIACFVSFSSQQFNRIWKWIRGIGIFFIVLTPTPFLIRDVDIVHGILRETPGPGFPLFIIYLIGSLSLPLYYLALQYHRAEENQRNQVGYLLLALCFTFAEAIFYFISVYVSELPLIYYYLQVVYAILVAYAILSHHLLDVRIVVRKTLVYSLTSAMLTAAWLFLMALIMRFAMAVFEERLAAYSALSACGITLLFNPLRTRMQRWIDRHFPRESLDQDLLQEAAGGFAHEMKRPLSKISLPAELALMDLERVKNGEKGWQEALPMIEERLHYIINQSLDAGYLIEAIRELSISSTTTLIRVDLRVLLENALNAERELLGKHEISVRNQLSNEPLLVSGRAKQLEIVFINLIKNAAEAMSDLSQGQPRILSIEGSSVNGDVMVRIIDTGPGIKPEDAKRIFQPQFTTKGGYGTGIGLYLSNQIVQAHGGSVSVKNKDQHGTVFELLLPARLQ